METDSGTREAVFEVRLSRPATAAFTIDYGTSDGSAVAGTDYTRTTGSLSFAVGQTVGTVRVPVRGDVVAETAETFFLLLTSPANPALPTNGLLGTATILDDDSSTSPVISISSASVGETFNDRLRFVVTLSEASAEAVTVDFRTLARTAREADLTDAFSSANNNGSIVFAPGQTSATIYIRPDSDSLDERDEQIVLELINPVGGVFAGRVPALRATGTILDDDGAGTNLSLLVSDPVLIEGNAGSREAVFELRLSRPADAFFSVSYETRNGSATAGDYTPTAGAVSFLAGQDVAYVRVAVAGDTLAETTESFFLAITPPANPALGITGLVGTATIFDDDTLAGPVFSLSGGSSSESFNQNIRFVVTLSAPSIDEVRIPFRTLNGSTTDYDLSSDSADPNNNGVLVFAPGQTTRSIFVRPDSDAVDERDEDVILELYDPSGGVFAGGTPVLRAAGIILDDDTANPICRSWLPIRC